MLREGEQQIWDKARRNFKRDPTGTLCKFDSEGRSMYLTQFNTTMQEGWVIDDKTNEAVHWTTYRERRGQNGLKNKMKEWEQRYNPE